MSCCLAILSKRLMPGSPSFQTFGQMRAGSHVLITRPMKFLPRFGQPFLNIHRPSGLGIVSFWIPLPPLGGPFFLLGFIFSHCRNPNVVSTFCLWPNLPTRVRVSIVPLLERVLCLCLCLCLSPKDFRLNVFPRSCDVLERLLNATGYRLDWWKDSLS